MSTKNRAVIRVSNGMLLRSKLTAAEGYRLKVIPHLHLMSMTTGHGTFEGWNLLALRMNTGHLASHQYFTDDRLIKIMQGGLGALREVFSKYKVTGVMAASEEPAKMISWALGLIDEMQDMCTRVEWTLVTEHVIKTAGVGNAKTVERAG